MKKVFIALLLVITFSYISDIKAYAVVSDYVEGQLNYDANGDVSFGYDNSLIYEAAYIYKDITKIPYSLNVPQSRQLYNFQTGEIVNSFTMVVAYGTDNIKQYFPETIYVFDKDNFSYRYVPISWEDVPEGALSHIEGYEFDLKGTGEDKTCNMKIYVLPADTLNTTRVAGSESFTGSEDIYSDGTYTGSFKTVKTGKIFSLNDGSRLAGCQAQIGGAWYSFLSDGVCCYNEYNGGYYYDGDGKRVEGVTYSWGKDGDYDVYASSNGIKITLSYALIDSELHFFDGLGHAWQTFDYPTYVLNEGNTLVGVPVQFDNVDKNTILEEIVKIRNDALQLGIISQDEYVVPKWSYGLERGSMIRACEAVLFSDIAHSRPANESAALSFDVYYDCSENCLAWGNGSTLGAISMYYSEKSSVLNNDGGVTGHYYALLYAPYIGTASTCMLDSGDQADWGSSNAYGNGRGVEGVNETKVTFSPYSIQLIEISADRLSVVSDQSVVSKVRGANIYTYNLKGIRRISGEGSLVKKKDKLYFQYPDGEYAKDTWIKTEGEIYYCDYKGVARKYKDGIAYTIDGISYKLHDINVSDGVVTGGTAEAYKVKKRYYYLNIYDNLLFGDAEFPVIKIASSMAKNDKKVNYVQIGENISSIGENAFYGCNNIREIRIYTKNLKASNVKKAFKKTSSSMKVYVPKKKLKAYRKLLRKRGISKKVKFKKLK